MKKKVYKLNDLKKKLVILKNKNKTIGFTNGCFDLLHEGHLKLLAESKKKCDYLIVGINSDSSIKKIKGDNRPIDHEIIRVNNLKKQVQVDAVILFSSKTPLSLIKIIKPNVLFKGSDYREKPIVGSGTVNKEGGKVILIDLLKGYSTTKLINKKFL